MNYSNRYTMSFISQRNRLSLKFFRNGEYYKSQATSTPYTPEDNSDMFKSAELETILSEYRVAFNRAILTYQTSGTDPFVTMFPKNKTTNSLQTPYDFFKSQKCNSFCEYIGRAVWESITDKLLEEYKETLESDDYADNTIKSYCQEVKQSLDKARRFNIIFPATEYPYTLSVKRGYTTSVYITSEELEMLALVETENPIELAVKTNFLLGAYTGARFSDFTRLSMANTVKDKYVTRDGKTVLVNSLRYIAEKTGREVRVPLKPVVVTLLKAVSGMQSISNDQINRVLPVLCKRAGIDELCTIKKCGKEFSGEKWKFVRSHTSRKSFATNLYVMGCPIKNISDYVGHKSITTTMENYIVCGAIYDESFINGFFGK